MEKVCDIQPANVAVPMGDEWLDFPSVGDMLGVCTETVARWARSGDLRVYRLSNRCVRVHRDDLADFLARKRQGQ